MFRSQQKKKEAERRVLTAARTAGAPIPNGEHAGEKPDFRFTIPDGVLGIKICEILRPATTNHGILPAEEESFHQNIKMNAQKQFERTHILPTRVNVYFSPARGKRQDRRRLIESVVNCVAQNRNRANPAVVVKHDNLPEGSTMS
jgi:hypothetical protein